jgi:hypothetical protein
MVYGCEDNLHSDLMAEVHEYVAVKVHGIVDHDLLWDVITADNVLPEEFFDSCGRYVGDRLRLNPFHEVLHCHNGEGVIALHWGEFADYVDAPMLQRPRWGDQLRRLCWGLGAM